MRFKKDLILKDTEMDRIKCLLMVEPETEKDCMGEDETVINTVQFENGIEMDIKICGVEYEEGSSNLPWTEAVLFKGGRQVNCSEPGDSYEGEWELEYEGNEYVVEVKSVKELWREFGDVPMNPETECIEEEWNGFPAGTHREDIWYWFEEAFDVSVAEDLMGL